MRMRDAGAAAVTTCMYLTGPRLLGCRNPSDTDSDVPLDRGKLTTVQVDTYVHCAKKSTRVLGSPFAQFCSRSITRMTCWRTSWSRHIFSRRRVLFGAFCHKFAENGPQGLKMVQKDASRNSTQSMIKICV
jgi:hypothetical protein